MFERLLFKHFGNVLKMGYVVPIENVPHIEDTTTLALAIAKNQAFSAQKLMKSHVRSLRLGDLLHSLGPCHLNLTLKLEWGHHDVFALYQDEHLVVTIKSIRFLDKPHWMVVPDSSTENTLQPRG